MTGREVQLAFFDYEAGRDDWMAFMPQRWALAEEIRSAESERERKRGAARIELARRMIAGARGGLVISTHGHPETGLIAQSGRAGGRSINELFPSERVAATWVVVLACHQVEQKAGRWFAKAPDAAWVLLYDGELGFEPAGMLARLLGEREPESAADVVELLEDVRRIPALAEHQWHLFVRGQRDARWGPEI